MSTDILDSEPLISSPALFLRKYKAKEMPSDAISIHTINLFDIERGKGTEKIYLRFSLINKQVDKTKAKFKYHSGKKINW